MIPQTYPIFNLAVILLLAAIYVYPIFFKRGLKYRQYADSRLNFWFFFIVVTLFCTFAFSNGDFINYAMGFKTMVRTGESSHFEKVYVWLVNHITQIYIAWRMIIWGGATYITLLAFKRLGLKSIPSYAALTVCYLTTLYIMRGNLGVAVMLYGLTLLINPLKGKLHLSYVLGVALMLISYFFHKSMILSLALLVPALMVDFDRRKILLCILLYPVAYFVIGYLLEYMGSNGLDGADAQISSYSRHYAQTKQFVANANGLFGYLVTFGASFYTVYFAYKVNLVTKLPKGIKLFFNYWFLWVYMAAVCYPQAIGGWYFSRFMFMSNLPWAVFLAYVYGYYYNTKQLRILTIWAMMGALYPIMMAVYKSL